VIIITFGEQNYKIIQLSCVPRLFSDFPNDKSKFATLLQILACKVKQTVDDWIVI
jgi:hypothetical protein